jgi:hypothetical protein
MAVGADIVPETPPRTRKKTRKRAQKPTKSGSECSDSGASAELAKQHKRDVSTAVDDASMSEGTINELNGPGPTALDDDFVPPPGAAAADLYADLTANYIPVSPFSFLRSSHSPRPDDDRWSWRSEDTSGDSDRGEPAVRITGRAYHKTVLIWEAIDNLTCGTQSQLPTQVWDLHCKFQRRVRRVHGRVFCSTAALNILRRIADHKDGAGVFLLLVCQIMTYTQTKDSYTVRQTHWMNTIGTVEKIKALSAAGKLRTTITTINGLINHYVSSGNIQQASEAAHFQVLIENTLTKIAASP